MNTAAPTPAYVAAQQGHVEVLRFLLDHGADVNRPMNREVTPAFIAALFGRVEVLRLLVDRGADVNLAALDGATPAFVAAREGHVKVLRLLVQAGADVDMELNGRRALTLAVESAHFEMARLLLRGGAALIAPNETLDPSHPELGQTVRPAPELLVALRMEGSVSCSRLLAYLGAVRAAGGWRPYIVEELRSLATLRALWRRRQVAPRSGPPTTRRRRRAPDWYGRPPASSSSLSTGEPPSGAASQAPPDSDDVALCSRIFRLPDNAANRILRYSIDLVL